MDTTNDLSQVVVSGTLVFERRPGKVTNLRTMGLFVQAGGRLVIGTECCPYDTKARITLLDPVPFDKNVNLGNFGFGTKVFAVMKGGSVEIFGAVRLPTWTEVSTTLPKGATNITLRDAHQWQVGDEIVVAGTDFDAGYSTRSIITAVGSTWVTVQTPLAHEAFGKTHATSGLREYAEVLHLTRNVVIEGAVSASDKTFGAHSVIVGTPTVAKIRGVEFINGGQAGILARYPIHFHHSGNVSGLAYLYDNSIHDSNQRCITIHDTHYLRVRRNVGFNAVGHCIFIEDGIETKNVIEYNAVVQILKGSLLPHDDTPTGIWITHPDNFINYNRASNIPAHCMWIALPVHPIGGSSDPTIWNRLIPLGSFIGNEVHSCARDGLHVDTGPAPDNTLATGNTDYQPQVHDKTTGAFISNYPQHSVIKDFRAWKVRNDGIWCRCTLDVEGGKFSNCLNGMTFATNDGKLAYPTTVRSSTFVMETDNLGEPRPWEPKGENGRSTPNTNTADTVFGGAKYPIRGFQFYDGPSQVDNCDFYGYADTTTHQSGSMSLLFKDRFDVGRMNTGLNVRYFDNSKPFLFPNKDNYGDQHVYVRDLDGSLTSFANSAVVQDFEVYRTKSCQARPDWKAFICPDHFSPLGISFNAAPATYPADGMAIEFRRDDKMANPLLLCGSLGSYCATESAGTKPTSFKTLVASKQYYNIKFRTSPPGSVRLIMDYSSSMAFRAPTVINDVRIALCYPPGTTVSNIMYNWKQGVTQQAASLSDLMTRPLDFSWNVLGQGHFFVDCSGVGCWIYVRMAPATLRNDTNLGGQPNLWVDVNVNVVNQNVGFDCGTPGGNIAEKAEAAPLAAQLAAPPARPPKAPDAVPPPRDDAFCGAPQATTPTTTTTVTTVAPTTTAAPTTAGPTTSTAVGATPGPTTTTTTTTTAAPTTTTTTAGGTTATITPAPLAADNRCDATQYANSLTLLNSRYLLYWTVDTAAQEIRICAEVQSAPLGWIGFGISAGNPSGNKMVGADLILGRMVNGVWTVSDRYADLPDPGAVGEDVTRGGTDDLLTRGGGRVGGQDAQTLGIGALKFSRKLITSDKYDRPISINGPTEILVAYSEVPSDDIRYHGNSRMYTTVNFGGGVAPVTTSPALGPCPSASPSPVPKSSRLCKFIFDHPAADFAKFDCATVMSRLTSWLHFSPWRLSVVNAKAGSFIMEVELAEPLTQPDPIVEMTSDQAESALTTNIRDLATALAPARLVSFTDSQGRVVSVSDPVSIGLIVGVVVGGLLLIAIIIVVIVLVVRKQRTSSRGYTTLGRGSSVSSYAPLESHYENQPRHSVSASGSVPPGSLRYVMIHSCVGSDAESTLSVSAGSTVYVQQSDFNPDSNWTWARTAEGKEGYIPTKFGRVASK